MTIGKDSVVIGNIDNNRKIGDGCVVIDCPDANGNIILNGKTIAIGIQAYATEGSIAIGAYASAGAATDDATLKLILQNLKIEIEQSKNISDDIKLLLNKTLDNTNEQTSKEEFSKSWETILKTCTVASVGFKIYELVEKICKYFHSQ